jgi:hypothetical protein
LQQTDFTTRFARGTEKTEGVYSFPLPGDDGKGKIFVDKLTNLGLTSLTARRAETFAGPLSPGPAKIHLLCALCVSVVIFLNKRQTMSKYLWPP